MKLEFIQLITAIQKDTIAIISKADKTTTVAMKNLKSNWIPESGFIIINFCKIGRKKIKVVKSNFCFMAFRNWLIICSYLNISS